MRHEPHNPRDLLREELRQRREAGFDLDGVADRAEAAVADEHTAGATLFALLDEVENTVRPAHWERDEPEELTAILAAAEPAARTGPAEGGGLPDDELHDRVYGAWLGRCAGNLLGKPVEDGDHWTPEHLREYLEQADAYPLRDYVPVLDPMPDRFRLRECWPVTTRGRITETARDDDLDYTILGLHVLLTRGRGYTRADVAAEWLDRLPYTQTYTAERVVYHNLVKGIPAGEARSLHNPYREWVGAQIRGDVFGYVCPGDPRAAAVLAFEDASLSHTANGVYGEMWAAALVAAAFTAADAGAALEASLGVVPRRSRLAEAVRFVRGRHEDGLSWEQARSEIGRRYGHYSWVHTVNNAALVTAGLLWGGGDYTDTIGLTVQGGWDTDSNGATAGSVAGALTGAAALPAHWTAPLNGTIRSAIRGYDNCRVLDLADRTVRLARGTGGPGRH